MPLPPPTLASQALHLPQTPSPASERRTRSRRGSPPHVQPPGTSPRGRSPSRPLRRPWTECGTSGSAAAASEPRASASPRHGLPRRRCRASACGATAPSSWCCGGALGRRPRSFGPARAKRGEPRAGRRPACSRRRPPKGGARHGTPACGGGCGGCYLMRRSWLPRFPGNVRSAGQYSVLAASRQPTAVFGGAAAPVAARDRSPLRPAQCWCRAGARIMPQRRRVAGATAREGSPAPASPSHAHARTHKRCTHQAHPCPGTLSTGRRGS